MRIDRIEFVGTRESRSCAIYRNQFDGAIKFSCSGNKGFSGEYKSLEFVPGGLPDKIAAFVGANRDDIASMFEIVSGNRGIA